MNRIETIILSLMVSMAAALGTLAVTMMSFPAHSTESFASASADMPLMVIRFNQRKVYFEQPLYNAASRAVGIKPDVHFNLVSYVPVTGESSKDQTWQNTASKNSGAVADSLRKMGVRQDQISVNRQAMPGLEHDEVHIFVR